jgi:chorismate-pyruvate lyase
MRRGLLESHKPIGFLMQEHRLETFREIVGCGRELADGLGPYFNVTETDGMIWRTYRVISGRQPIMLITEKFPDTHFPA